MPDNQRAWGRWIGGSAIAAAALIALCAQPAGAQDLPPRPTAEATAAPTAAPTAQPSATTKPSATSSPTREHRTAVPAGGRITGTVIDATTGAPASGVVVDLGGILMLSDANGSYDRSGLPPGTYQVRLVLRDDQGSADQPPIDIALTSGATVVQHLSFHQPH